ncbi:MAG TPA: hypothetical protein VF365_08570 [Candidatus Limnocylindria bacterium]
MANPVTASPAPRPRSEEADAAYGAVMAVTAAGGGMIAIFDVVEGSLPFTAAPTIVLLVAMLRHSTTASAWSGVAVWATVLGMAPGLAVVAPILMAILCLSFAVGPDRLLDWIHHEWTGRDLDPRVEAGWIEDERSGDGGRVT